MSGLRYFILWMGLLFFLALGGVSYYLMSMGVKDSIVCASDGGFNIPSSLCEFYLLNLRDAERDAVDLEEKGGLSFILSGYNDKKYSIAQHFIENGVDVNKSSYLGGQKLNPVVLSIKLNDPKMLEFLISNGADLSSPFQVGELKEEVTAREYIEYLQSRGPDVDRSKMAALVD